MAVAASRNGAALVPIVAHKRSFCPWLVTMDAETFFRLLRGEFPMSSNSNFKDPTGSE